MNVSNENTPRAQRRFVTIFSVVSSLMCMMRKLAVLDETAQISFYSRHYKSIVQDI